MNRKFRMDVVQDGATTKIAIHGTINEDADFANFVLPKTKEIHFDFAHVTALNSCGVREWLRFIDAIDHDIRIVYYQCTQGIVEQINMIQNFLTPGSVVASFFAPYYCEKCDEERKILLRAKDVPDGGVPGANCPDCGNEMEFDAIEDNYFHFLDTRQEAG